MATKPLPIDKPTRRTVEQLFRDLRRCSTSECPHYREYQRLREERDALEKKLLNVPAYKSLKQRGDRAYSRHCDRDRKLATRIHDVHRLYLANGLTAKVVAEINKLLKFAKGR